MPLPAEEEKLLSHWNGPNGLTKILLLEQLPFSFHAHKDQKKSLHGHNSQLSAVLNCLFETVKSKKTSKRSITMSRLA